MTLLAAYAIIVTKYNIQVVKSAKRRVSPLFPLLPFYFQALSFFQTLAIQFIHDIFLHKYNRYLKAKLRI